MTSARIRLHTPLPALLLGLLASLSASTPQAFAQSWVVLVDETATRLCPPAASCPDPSIRDSDDLEKDLASADVDGDGDLDLVAVRKVRASTPGGRPNFLFLNEDGILAERSVTPDPDDTDLVPGFANPTDDRDIVVVDLDGINGPDLVTTTTFGQQPRVYLNRGGVGAGWLGFEHDTDAMPLVTNPCFCALAAGDITGDDRPDIYMVDYRAQGPVDAICGPTFMGAPNDLDDRLFVLEADGTFTDATGPGLALRPAAADSLFGTDVHIVDVDKDGWNDVVKNSGFQDGVFVLYNDAGTLPTRTRIYDRTPYMIEPADFDGNGWIDFYVVDDDEDHLLFGSCDDVRNDGSCAVPVSFQEVPLDPNGITDGWSGNIKIADLEGDGFLDVIVADFDTNDDVCNHNSTVLLRGQPTADGGFELGEALTLRTSGSDGPLQGVFDVEPFDIDGDSCLDLVAGACDGWHVFMQRLPAGALTVIEPVAATTLPPGSRRLLVRVELTPRYLAEQSEFEVQIGGQPAPILDFARVGEQVWMTVEASAELAAGADHDLDVTFRRCSGEANVRIDDAIRFRDADLDVVMVLDASGSMRRNGKLDAAKNAASLLINTLADDDKVGIAWFAGKDGDGYGITDVPVPLRPAGGPAGGPGGGPVQREFAITQTRAINARGTTPIGEGLLTGGAEIESAGLDTERLQALVLLSDGMENVANFWGDVPARFMGSAPPNTPVRNSFGEGSRFDDVKIYTVALGPNSTPDLMREISTHTGVPETETVDLSTTPRMAFLDLAQPVNTSGVTLAAERAAPVTELSLANRLANVYEHLHNDQSRQQRLWQGSFRTAVVRPSVATLASTSTARVLPAQQPPLPTAGAVLEVPMEPGLSFATLSVNWPDPERLKIRIDPPPGQAPGAIERHDGPTNAVLRIEMPAAGNWRVTVDGPPGVEGLVVLSGRGNILGMAHSALTTQRFLDAGALVPVAVALFGGDPASGPITNAEVTAVASSASGIERLTLRDDGRGADTAAGDGVYTANLRRTERGGAIAIETLARWTAADGVVRERVFPSSVVLRELDSDGDGVSDEDEIATGVLDPSNPDDAGADPDGDGLTTALELRLEPSLDPSAFDTDGGGAGDGAELCSATDPLDPADDTRARQDRDGDGMPDPWEERFGFDPDNPNDATRDADRDGLDNRQEHALCTSPLEVDSDGDGIWDDDEAAAGTDPTGGGVATPPEPGDPPTRPSKAPYSIALRLGFTEPVLDFGDVADGERYFELEGARRLTPRVSIAAVLGRYRFEIPGLGDGTSRRVDIDGLTAYGRYHWPRPSGQDLHVGGGVGVYDPDFGGDVPGLSLTAGWSTPLAPRWRFEVEAGAFHLLSRGDQDEIDFLILGMGLRLNLR